MQRFLIRLTAALTGGVVVFAAVMAASLVMITRNPVSDAVLFAQVASILIGIIGLAICHFARPRRIGIAWLSGAAVLFGVALARRFLGEQGHVPTLLVMYVALIVVGSLASMGSYRWMMHAYQTAS